VAAGSDEQACAGAESGRAGKKKKKKKTKIGVKESGGSSGKAEWRDLHMYQYDR
jgi:hypothetical protein